MINEKIDFDKRYRTDNKEHSIIINISSDDEIFLYKVKKDGKFTEHVYTKHRFCGGTFVFRDLKKYKILTCDCCNLRVVIPKKIKTIKQLKEYFEKENPEEKINSRSEILDIREKNK